MSERKMRKNVVDWLKPLDAFAVENPANPGTPDVNYIEGWIELKQLDAWPASDNTPVRLPHYTPQQRIRARKRWRKGGNVYWLLQVRNDWLLLEGHTAAELYDGESAPTRAQLFNEAIASWNGQNSVRKHLRSFLSRYRISPTAKSSSSTGGD